MKIFKIWEIFIFQFLKIFSKIVYYYYYYYQPFDRRRSTTTASGTCPLVRLAWSGLEKELLASDFGQRFRLSVGPRLAPG